jgi:hypothetical protein
MNATRAFTALGFTNIFLDRGPLMAPVRPMKATSGLRGQWHCL